MYYIIFTALISYNYHSLIGRQSYFLNDTNNVYYFICFLPTLSSWIVSKWKGCSSSSLPIHNSQFHHSSIIEDVNLYILYVYLIYPTHFFPLIALGAEIVRRGYQLTILGQLLKVVVNIFPKCTQND